MRKFLMLIACTFTLLRLSAATYTLYFNNSAGWSEVGCYVWTDNGSNEVLGGWPGTNITNNEKVEVDGTNYIKVSFTSDASGFNVIFNNMGNGAQTGNLSVVNDGKYNKEGFVSGGNGGDNSYHITGTLPVIYINCTEEVNGVRIDDYNLRDKDYRIGTYWLDANGIEGLNSVGSEEAPLPLQIKARGNYTRSGFAKKPFKLKLDAKQSLLGLSKSKHFALLNHADDTDGYLRNFVGFYLGNMMEEADARMWSPNEIPVEVVINGDYRGIYFLAESIRVDSQRINIPELEGTETDVSILSGGYLVELDNYLDDATLQIYGNNNTGDRVWVTPDTPEEYTPLMKRFVTDQFTTITNLIKQHSDETWKYLDLDAAARYYIIMEVLNHWEAYHGSTYLYRDRGENKKWIFSPVWDFGHALDGWGNNRFLYESGPEHYGNTWIADMVRNDKFMNKVKENWQWFWGNKVDGLYAAIDEYAAKIAEAAAMDHVRWAGILPEFYLDPLNHNAATNPTAIADNTNIQDKKNNALNNLRAKINWLSQQWGQPQAGMEMPAADTTEAAPLPDYLQEGGEIIDPSAEYIVYYKSKSANPEPVQIWFWTATSNYTGGVWETRPAMEKATDANGETYYYFIIDTTDDLSGAQLIITEKGENLFGDKAFENKALYSVNGSITEHNWDPNKGNGPVVNTPVYIYLYDEAGWCTADNSTPSIYVYAGNNTNGAWNTIKMERMPVGSTIEGYTSTENKALFSYLVPENLVNGQVMFYCSGSMRYPADNQPGLYIDNKSKLFVNNNNHDFITIETPTYSGTLPVLVIKTTDGSPVPADKSKTTGTAYIDNVDSGETWSVGSATSPVALKKIKGHGSTSWTDFHKKPYKLEFEKKQTFGSLPKSKHYLLLPYATDSELDFLSNITGHELAKAIGLKWTPGQLPVEVIINDEYLGLYFLVENIRPAGERVQQYDFGDMVSSREDWNNWIVEIDNTKTAEEAHKVIKDADGNELYVFSDAFEFDDPKWNEAFPEADKESMLLTTRNCFDTLIGKFEQSLSDTKNGIGNWMNDIDCDEAARYCVVQELMDDTNAFTTAFYMTYTGQDPDGIDVENKGWCFGPVWDFSHAFASKGEKTKMLDEYGTVPVVGSIYHYGDFFTYISCYFRLFSGIGLEENTQTPQRVVAQGGEFIAGSALESAWNNVVAQYNKYQPALANEYKRWNGAYAVAATTANTPESDGSALDTVKGYLLNNTALLASRVNGGIITGINSVNPDEDAPVEYFDITGRRIATPQPGTICIRRQGANVQKYIAH